MCVCVCVCIFCIVRLEPLSRLSFSIFFIADNISVSVYIMGVILCLFGALSCRVGTLQNSIIIITRREDCQESPPGEFESREMELGCHWWTVCLAAELFLNSRFTDSLRDFVPCSC